MGEVALDASVVIGLLEPNDAHHSLAVSQLSERARRRDRLLLVSSAYLETLVGPMRRGYEDTVDGFIEENDIEIVAVGRALARLAAQLRADHPSLRLGDSLVLASARARDAELLTFDDRLRRVEVESRR